MNHENMTELELRQINLEMESLALGQERYWKEVKRNAASGRADQDKPAVALIRRTSLSLTEAIEVARTPPQMPTGKRHRAESWVVKTRGLPSDALAHITLRCALSSGLTTKGIVKVARPIGQAVWEELTFRRFQAEDPDGYKITQQHITKAINADSRRAIMRRMLRHNLHAEGWSPSLCVKVGLGLLMVLLGSHGDLFETLTIPSAKNKSERLFSPTRKLEQWLLDGHERLSMLCPTHMPMLSRPVDWSGPTGGGYLMGYGSSKWFVKTHNRPYLQSLSNVHMPEVYEAVNRIQSTGWKINTAILDVVQECHRQGIQVGSLPSPEDLPVPAMPSSWEGDVAGVKQRDPVAYKAWASKAAAVHDENRRLFSKRMLAAEQIRIAEKFRAETTIYFPHQLDFRGRIYPIPVSLNPQSSDLGKALLCFSEGKPITERGIWWLKVHLANCFGVDKVSFEQRVGWTEQMMDKLLACGLDPMNETYWHRADDPWLALAACFELVGVGVNGAEHVSHLSIPMDGTCNGLQNYSALLRDPVGAKSTNIVPSPSPQDIYGDVAKEVSRILKRHAEEGNEYAIRFDGKITRSIVKQPVMTLPYGVTKQGMMRQLEDAVLSNLPGLFPRNMTWKACTYLADVVEEALSGAVVAAVAGMDWLRECAKAASSLDTPIRWTSPIGFPVLQEYRELDMVRINIHVGGQRTTALVGSIGHTLSKRRQSAGISPNLIHSYDASHLMSTVVIGGDNGIESWAMIHDSYGTHACNTDLLHVCLREAFIEQYGASLLDQFREELLSQLPEGSDLPPVPPTGNLEVETVRDSGYFFA